MSSYSFAIKKYKITWCLIKFYVHNIRHKAHGDVHKYVLFWDILIFMCVYIKSDERILLPFQIIFMEGKG